MQDQQPSSLGQIELTAAAPAGKADDPAQLANIYPADFAACDRDLAAILGNGRSSWRAAAGFAAVFALGWVGGSNAHRLSDLVATLGLLPQPVKSSSASPDFKIKPAARTELPARNTLSDAGAQTASLLRTTAPAASVPSRAQKPSLAAIQPVASSSLVVEPAKLPADLVAPREPLVAAPETKPTTIDGWTVRDVHGAMAVLEGPDGVVTVARGDTVPGVGRIDSIVRWGNRWIVATAGGLIATP